MPSIRRYSLLPAGPDGSRSHEHLAMQRSQLRDGVRLLEGRTVEDAKEGAEIFVRCKVAAKGTRDWHGLILGRRAPDCVL